MDNDLDPWAGTAITTLSRDAATEPHGRGDEPSVGSRGAGRTVATVFRGLLVFMLVLTGPLAVIVWATMPRVTSPTQVAEQAIEAGLTAAVRESLVDQLSSELAERRASPTQSPQMRSVFERSLSQAWFDEQVRNVTADLEVWLGGTGQRPPLLVIDLTPVKASLAADPEALFLVADLVGAEEVEGSVAAALAGVPDEVELLSETAEPGTPEGLFAARDYLVDARRVRPLIPIALVSVFALIVLLSRRGARLGWTGRTLALIGVPLLVASFVMPALTSQIVAGAVPADIPLDATDIADLLSWMLEPVRPVAIGLAVSGLVLLVVSFGLGVVHRRQA